MSRKQSSIIISMNVWSSQDCSQCILKKVKTLAFLSIHLMEQNKNNDSLMNTSGPCKLPVVVVVVVVGVVVVVVGRAVIVRKVLLYVSLHSG